MLKRITTISTITTPPKSFLPWCQFCGATGQYVPHLFIGNRLSSIDCCVSCLPTRSQEDLDTHFYFTDFNGHRSYLQPLR